MYPTQLKPLLAKGTFGPDCVTAIVALCDDWYRDEASLEAFTFRSIFHELNNRGWDDPQGICTPLFQQFVADILPRLDAVLAALPGNPIDPLKILVYSFSTFIQP